MVGTCGAAWNSSFVPRKLSSSHHDVITPREVTLIGRGFRVAAPKSSRELSQRESLALCAALWVWILWDIFYSAKMLLFGRGTCGAAWNSLFVPRKLSSSHHDFLIPWKSYIVEPIGWWYLAARGSTFPSISETFPYMVMSHPKLGTVAKLL